MSHESHDVDELGWSGLGHMTEPDHHKYKDPNYTCEICGIIKVVGTVQNIISRIIHWLQATPNLSGGSTTIIAKVTK